ncbi:uncharacterized protein EDB91DRAFT_1051942, partial [Suillus paluster]|uniref:uncharacterized protein n=1 Tax=Suillus paluster TaxID=48578 RepID=UPI001B8780F1
FKTNAVRCTWFSCRWEFFSGLIGALKGHLNTWLCRLIHSDTSDGNTWFWVPIADQDHTVPNWCIDEGVPKFCGETVESEWFPMRPGMIGDFSLALDFLDDSEKALEEKKKWTTMVRSSFFHAFCWSAHESRELSLTVVSTESIPPISAMI